MHSSEKREFKNYPLLIMKAWASLVAHLVKNQPAMRETWVRSLGWEDPLEKEKANPLYYSGLENPIDPWRSLWGRKSQILVSTLT